ncbi:predicted protein [Aspergillus terreus NIH2624]|uniref:Uncharacterized protein n=1 Tax=Aspergillus terreus (strain NIH 2624 / FGSC A1156) TaxID=341663 RepID=Q0CH92_ASPTN|nr:uncharacterized protein ATEG_06950 [Aspergillus terreus NIH2624]EAU32334.1 predicted protein [Aspergillus terreus NIH2624]
MSRWVDHVGSSSLFWAHMLGTLGSLCSRVVVDLAIWSVAFGEVEDTCLCGQSPGLISLSTRFGVRAVYARESTVNSRLLVFYATPQTSPRFLFQISAVVDSLAVGVGIGSTFRPCLFNQWRDGRAV